MAIVYYITSHGFGHGTRSCEVIRELRRQDPDCPLHIVSRLPADFLHGRIGEALSLHPRSCDVGVVQRDAIRSDLDATYRAVDALIAQHDQLVEAEAAWLRSIGARIVICDIPAIPIAAARACQIPSIAIGNFSWDWIYRNFTDHSDAWLQLADHFAADYRLTDLLLELPFSAGMDAFPNRQPLPLLAQPGVNRRDHIARTLGIPPNERWVLLGFTTLNLDPDAPQRLSAIPSTQFLLLDPMILDAPNAHPCPHQVASFSDVMASCDLVVSKPGFGIVSDCIANQKPILYTDRDNFAEYPILVEGIERHLAHAFVPSDQLYAGELDAGIDAALQASPGKPLALDGAPRAAGTIIRMRNQHMGT